MCLSIGMRFLCTIAVLLLLLRTNRAALAREALVVKRPNSISIQASSVIFAMYLDSQQGKNHPVAQRFRHSLAVCLAQLGRLTEAVAVRDGADISPN